jgi:spore germination cell wall hydrolase CwlJ-like protein
MIEILFWLSLTVYHEARGESPTGQKAVVKVIMNRSIRKGWSVADIVRARKQFSCYNEGIKSIYSPLDLLEVMQNAYEGLEEWKAGDTLSGATHYYAIKGMVDGKPPYWAKGMTVVCEIEGHKFLREV